jgi:ribonuclease T1
MKRLNVARAAGLLLLVLMLALGSCAAGGAFAPDSRGAQPTPTAAATPSEMPSPARQAALTATQIPARRATVTAAATPSQTRTPKRQASATPTRSSTRRATATPTVALSGLPTIQYDKLPVQARDTIALIQSGGPFPYRQDGAVFQNRERLLPTRPNGYYHEYTVKTPGSPDRGARRIIAGGKGELYYTDDHYDSFKQVVMP